MGAPCLTSNLTFDMYCTVCRLSVKRASSSPSRGAENGFPALGFSRSERLPIPNKGGDFGEDSGSREHKRERDPSESMMFDSADIAVAPLCEERTSAGKESHPRAHSTSFHRNFIKWAVNVLRGIPVRLVR